MIKMEHVLILIIVAFVLYKFMSRCSYIDGFSLGGQESNTNCDISCHGLVYSDVNHSGKNVCEFNQCSASDIYTSIENFGCSDSPNGFIDKCCNLQKCKSTCNNDNDCNSHKCNDGLCQCKNDNFNFNAIPPCSECNNTYLDPDRLCRSCKDRDGIDGDLLDPDYNCEKCINHYDISSSCTKCIYNNLDINTSCTTCIDDNLDISTSCIRCKYRNGIHGFYLDPDYNCEKCMYNLDINTSCTTCINDNLDINSWCTKCINDNLDINTSCTTCINDNLDLDEYCQQCKDRDGIDGYYLDLEDCTKCKDRDGIDGFYLDPDENCEKCMYNLDINTSCTTCINNNLNPDTLCTTCKDRDGIDGFYLDPKDCTKCKNDKLNFNANPPCSECNNTYLNPDDDPPCK